MTSKTVNSSLNNPLKRVLQIEENISMIIKDKEVKDKAMEKVNMDKSKRIVNVYNSDF